MDEVRPRLEAFAVEMLGSLARRDQRAKGELYVRGLMLDGKRKSMQPGMRICPGTTRIGDLRLWIFLG
ncbi:hypothetical protein GCM10010121_099020 [Streptomyces brasiliensis]|uniref:Transposase IS701-like DDE domain-containing protein n=1 Tax=Streptomyces brasiliensis TaxID=1954 RepID=A0A917PE27_9ACTN|nr:hypothetical protein GCM10010121_099020 [Streptomyces brasiliensis]